MEKIKIEGIEEGTKEMKKENLNEKPDFVKEFQKIISQENVSHEGLTVIAKQWNYLTEEAKSLILRAIPEVSAEVLRENADYKFLFGKSYKQDMLDSHEQVGSEERGFNTSSYRYKLDGQNLNKSDFLDKLKEKDN